MSSYRTRVAPLSCLVLSLSFVASPAVADVKLPPFFSDHMVLQRETRAPVWGTAAPGEKVTVKFRDQQQTATADKDGRWRVEFTGLKAGGPDELTIAGNNSITFKDVLVGEVWVGSGQSNMAGTVASYAKDDKVLAQLASAAHPMVRGCKAGTPWQVSSPATNPAFSAILFAFAVRLQEQLNVPVGMMLGAVGGTPSGAWLSETALKDDAACQALIADYAKTYDAQLKDFNERVLPAWQKGAEAAKAAGKPVGRQPSPPPKPGTANGQPAGYLYKAHLLPLVGYGMRGVLWDQGESGTAVGGVDQYSLMGALIRGWRKEWDQGEFAFIYVQKYSGGGCAWDNANPVTSHGEAFTPLPANQPGYLDAVQRASDPGRYLETHIRIRQYPNIGMATSSDLGPNTHPINKSGYGSRAATVALGMTYGKPVEYYGPIYASHAVEGNKVRIKFTHVGQGLTWRHGDKLQGFAIAGDDKNFVWADGPDHVRGRELRRIAGDDKNFVWADAEIDGDTVVVSSPNIAKPASVRYAWAGKRPWANLFNKDGLPALTFRTDAW